VIQLGRERCQCRLDVTKAGTVGELRVAHHKELVTAGELQGMEVSIVFVNTFVCCKNTKIFRIVPYYFTKHAQFNEKLEIIPHPNTKETFVYAIHTKASFHIATLILATNRYAPLMSHPVKYIRLIISFQCFLIQLCKFLITFAADITN
jgi:hypothetical protein